MNMTQTFEERLNQILPRITSEDFPAEPGAWERDRLLDLRLPAWSRNWRCASFWRVSSSRRSRSGNNPLRFATINLFRVGHRPARGPQALDKAIDMQGKQGDDKALESLRRVLKKTSFRRAHRAAAQPGALWIC